jgi:hypothetical protein
MSDAEQRARKEQEDRKAQDAATKAYNAASKTPPSEDPRDGVRGQKGYAKGGSASSRADGCATKGKTRGTMITMKGGGYAC